MALTASDYIVLNGLGIANSWAQNRMARLSLEQRDKAQAQDELFRRDEMRRRDEEARLDRENRMAVADKTIEREDVRQSGMLDRFDKNQARQAQAALERMAQEDKIKSMDIASKMEVEKSREDARLKIEQMKMAKDGLTSVGAGIGRLLGVKTKDQIAADAEERKANRGLNSEALRAYGTMSDTEKLQWEVVESKDGGFTIRRKPAAAPAAKEPQKPTGAGKLSNGVKFRIFNPAPGY